MSGIPPSRFAEFYAALHEDKTPFPWQRRLAERVCAGDWPGFITVPTAAGKTACIDIAIFALACGAAVPRRIFFVVDRRIIVQQAYRRATGIAAKLIERSRPILAEVADALIALGADEKQPLDCFELRGGIYRDDSWIRSPIQPTVIASTVDQVGSRILFRGYGLRSGLLRPVHAALAANDSLILLDEAHCSLPFSQTIAAVKNYRQWGQDPLSSPFHFVQLTATPSGATPDSAIESDKEDDLKDPVLGPRMAAAKEAKLVVAAKAKGREWRKGLVAELVSQARELMGGDIRSVGVIVNRVATAQDVYQLLLSERKKPDDYDVQLLIGRMRPLDRDEALEGPLARVASGAKESVVRPLLVVATQCLEVGADLDFDGLVSECASLDALRQRFGRLNRLGRVSRAYGRIVIRADQVQDEDDPIYQKSLSTTWNWLVSNSTDNVIDFGVTAMRAYLETVEAEQLASLNAPTRAAPMLMPAHLDCFVQTAPAPSPDPDPAIFLHGPDSGPADVTLVWRSDLVDTEVQRKFWKDIVSLCPPSAPEAMPVPVYTVRKWMKDQLIQDDGADVEGTERDEGEPSGSSFAVLRWCGPDSDRTKVLTQAEEVQPGDTIVVAATAGGYNVFGHVSSDWIDRGDEAYAVSRNFAILRVNGSIPWPGIEQSETFKALQTDEAKDDPDRRKELIESLLGELSSNEALPEWMKRTVEHLKDNYREKAHPLGGWVLKSKSPIDARRKVRVTTDEDDTASAQESDQKPDEPVTLAAHSQGVEAYARTFATRLAPRYTEVLRWAARWHDLGKADPRFQAWLRCVPRRAIPSQLIAKSERMPKSAAALQQARTQAGYPEGGRHEMLSVRLAESRLDHLPSEVCRDLLLHLIASHHGHGRPFVPAFDEGPNDKTPVFEHLGVHFASRDTATSLQRIDSGVAERFWMLVRRHGWWGLAYLEAMLRLADHRRSEDEEEPCGKR
jgi:CRISPR-associated endonuclease/helicase Cas3